MPSLRKEVPHALHDGQIVIHDDDGVFVLHLPLPSCEENLGRLWMECGADFRTQTKFPRLFPGMAHQELSNRMRRLKNVQQVVPSEGCDWCFTGTGACFAVIRLHGL